LNEVFGKDSEVPLVFLKVRDVDGDPYACVFIQWAGDSIPEIFSPELAGAVWQRRVKNQSQRVEQIRLADLVLAKDHGRPTNGDIQLVEVPKVLDMDVSNSHFIETPSRVLEFSNKAGGATEKSPGAFSDFSHYQAAGALGLVTCKPRDSLRHHVA
jgi:hypothetical protein